MSIVWALMFEFTTRWSCLDMMMAPLRVMACLVALAPLASGFHVSGEVPRSCFPFVASCTGGNVDADVREDYTRTERT